MSLRLFSSKPMIMIIGSERDYHAKHIHQKMKERSIECFYLDTEAFPRSLKLNLTPKERIKSGSIITTEGQKIPLESISSVYWRYRYGVDISPEIPPDIGHLIFREIDSALGSLFRNMPHAFWVNPVSAIERHRYKTHQLFLMAQAGIPMPDTLVSNDPEEITSFYEQHNGHVIYKPVSGGAHTERMKPEDLSEDRLKNLQLSPVQFQEFVEGTDIRAYLVGDSIFAAEIRAKSIDFRDDPGAPIVRVKLPEEVDKQCRILAKMFEYEFTGIDIRRTPSGESIFIEGNPCPMFTHFEEKTGYPITNSLIKLLESGESLGGKEQP